MTGIASAAKFVPQRGEKRLGRTVAGPGALERACLGRRDRAMLGAVQAQRASAEEPEDDQRRREQSRRKLEPARQRDEAERRQERAEEEEALARAGDATSAGERRHRRRQLHQAAHERDPGGRGTPARHLALVQLTGVRRERPVVLADDHDAVRAGHAAELAAARQRGRRARERRRRRCPPTHRRRKKAARRVPDGLIPARCGLSSSGRGRKIRAMQARARRSR